MVAGDYVYFIEEGKIYKGRYCEGKDIPKELKGHLVKLDGDNRYYICSIIYKTYDEAEDDLDDYL